MEGRLERRWIYVILIIIGLLLLFFYPRGGNIQNESPTSIDQPKSSNHETSSQPLSKHLVDTDNGEGKSSELSALPNSAGLLTAQDIEKARSLAKTTLSSLYTAQRAYMAEFLRPTSDLLSLGFTPDGSVMNYKAGFLEALQTEEFNDITNDGRPAFREDPRRINTDVFLEEKQEDKATRYEYSAAAAQINMEDYKSLCRIGCRVQGQEFEFMIIVPLDDTHFDVWTMNNLKQLNLVRDGTRKD